MRAARLAACRRSSSARTRLSRSTPGFRATRRPASPTSLKWAGGNANRDSRAKVEQPIPFHAPASTQRHRAGWRCFRDLLRVRRNTPHSDYSGGGGWPREHRRRAPSISRSGRGGGGFSGSFHTPGCPPDGPRDCRRIRHCWRTVGPCAPLGWRRQWYCQPASAVGRGARIGRICGWLLAARGKTAAGRQDPSHSNRGRTERSPVASGRS